MVTGFLGLTGKLKRQGFIWHVAAPI